MHNPEAVTDRQAGDPRADFRLRMPIKLVKLFFTPCNTANVVYICLPAVAVLKQTWKVARRRKYRIINILTILLRNF